MDYCVKFCVNNEPVELTVSGSETLLHVLREKLGYTGTKEGCGAGECGACTIILNGKAVTSCIVLAVEAEGAQITTVEGLSKNGKLSILQEEFVSQDALQCGFCTPGFLMSTRALLDQNPNPTDEEIVEVLSGNLCRCTGYIPILQAVKRTAERERKELGR